MKSAQTTEFLAGARDTFPLIVGAIPFGIIYGTLAVGSGLSVAATLAMSAFVFAGSAQFIAVGLVAAGSGWPLIVLTTFVVNLRHALYSATLAPFVSKLPQRWQIPLAFWLTDETFAVVVDKCTRFNPPPETRWYYLGSALAMYLNWQLCTILGVTAGQMLPDAAAWGLDFAMPVTFIGMVIPYLKNRAMVATTLVAGAAALLTFYLPHKLGLMAATLAGIAAGVAVEKWGE
ncbi:MAG: AzlC family ABC transporter permease [Anaerolineae bacterium]